MPSWSKPVILTALVVALPASAFAQRRVPATGSAAIGGDVGVFVARDPALSSGPTVEGFYEYYVTPRGSVRMGVGWANPKFENESADSIRHIRVALDGVYNWEGGAIHPFVGAGVGVYFLQPRDNGHNLGDSQTKPGGTVFGGAEFFANRNTSIKGEARYHFVKDFNGVNPDGLSLTIGVKRYF